MGLRLFGCLCGQFHSPGAGMAMAGDRVTVPGAGNQLAALWGQHMPRSVLLPLVKRIWPVS